MNMHLSAGIRRDIQRRNEERGWNKKEQEKGWGEKERWVRMRTNGNEMR
jgi:hypothetical protein